MATGSVNAKSQKIHARVSHEIIANVELAKNEGESTSQFVVTALQGEIKRRQREKTKPDESKG
ncbi:YlcI/YnfO family protein [Candidatus Regiella insecticola]|uniref:YlcI/YnfO family protein n=1 Tax=Candidatus Regiella insecticola TaxID=138073 RepID=UPI0002EB11DF|nr:YlcI/YnfO family protein [Candidatus Regiella insecticola]